MFSTKNNKIVIPFLITILCTSNAHSAFIETSNNCQGGTGCDPAEYGEYGYNMKIVQDTNDATIFNFTLLNTSPNAAPFALIDAFAMNMGDVSLGTGFTLGTDFTVGGFNPSSWAFAASGNNVQFDYVGDAGNPGTRLLPDAALTFYFDFDTNTSFAPWINAGDDLGKGFGGGKDIGQVAVSFQQLGINGDGSDLLASYWEPENPNDPNNPNDPTVPEPSSLLLLSLGLLGSFGASRRKAK